jgi:GNAT superfamily N-acetyltransferase
MALTVRPAGVHDVETLAALVRELNAHQRDPTDRCAAETLRREGFGETRRFEALLAEIDGRPVGYALFVPAFDTAYGLAGLYVQDLYVVDEHRGQAVGRALLAAVAAKAQARDLGFLWWASRTWNVEAHRFFRRFASVEEPVVAFASFGEQLARLAAEGRGRDHDSDPGG